MRRYRTLHISGVLLDKNQDVKEDIILHPDDSFIYLKYTFEEAEENK